MQGGQGDRGMPLDSGPPSTPEDSEDFLFHLYRGSELLLDNRVHEAKEELEQALKLQPRDAKGQDLLAVVYFRLGLYPRAIGIYEDLAHLFPDDISLSQNLALCYLKTSQAEKARELLEKVVAAQPKHARAWSYLGLAYEKLGDYDKAKAAFAQGQQPGMAKRMDDLLTTSVASSERAVASAAHDLPHEFAPEEQTLPGLVPKVHPPAVLGKTEVAAITAAMTMPAPPDASEAADLTPLVGSQVAVLQPFSPVVTASSSSRPPPSAKSIGTIPGMAAPFVAPWYPGPHLGVPASQVSTAAKLALDTRLAFPAGSGALLHPSGLVLVRVEQSFAVRPPAIRIMGPDSGAFKSAPLHRRARMRTMDEPLGGTASPMAMLTGSGQLALAPHPEHHLLAVRLDDEFLYVREVCLVGFDGGLSYENGRLAAFEGDAVAMVQIRGRGCVVIETAGAIASMEVNKDRPATVAREIVLGWTGRLLPIELPPEEAPAAAGGFVSFTGEGKVIVTAKAMPG